MINNKQDSFKSISFILIFFVLGIIIRLLNYPILWIDNNILFPDPDIYYHLRRIVLLLYNNLYYIPFDSYLHSFTNQPTYWSPYFDIFISIIVLIFNNKNIEFIASFIPPVIGSLTVIPVFLLTKTLFNQNIALFSALLFSFSFESIFISSFAYVDHHFMEVFCIVWFLFFFVKGLQNPQRNIWGIMSGFSLGFSVLMQIASVIYVGIFILYFIIHYIYLYLKKQEKEILVKITFQTSLTASLVILLPCAFSYSGVNFLVKYDNLSWFQFLFLFLISIFVLFIDYFNKCFIEKSLNFKNYLIFIFYGILSIFLLYIILKPSFSGLSYILLKSGNPLYYTVAELKPTQILDFKYIIGSFSILFYFLPIILGYLFYKLIKENSLPLFFFFIWTVLIGIMTLSSTRFSFLFIISMNILISFSFFLIRNIFQKRSKTFVFTILTIFLIIIIYPMIESSIKFQTKKPWMKLSIYQSMKWLKNNTPVTNYYYNPVNIPEYNILAQWDMGFPLTYLAERPVVADGYFGNGSIPSQFMFNSDQSQAESIIQKYNVKYIMLTNIISNIENHLNITGKKFNPPLFKGELTPGFNVKKAMIYLAPFWFIKTMYARLFLHDGRNIGNIEELNHYRLIYESKEFVPYYILNSPDNNYAYMLYYNLKFPINTEQFYILNKPGGEVKIFEYVKGVTLKGKTSPNTEIKAIVKVITNQKREFIYITKTLSNRNGDYNIILPYSTEKKESRTNTVGRYLILGKDLKKYLSISEQDVILGKTIFL